MSGPMHAVPVCLVPLSFLVGPFPGCLCVCLTQTLREEGRLREMRTTSTTEVMALVSSCHVADGARNEIVCRNVCVFELVGCVPWWSTCC